MDLHKFQENTWILDVTIYLSAVSVGDDVFIYGFRIIRLEGFLCLHSLVYYYLSKQHSNKHVHCVFSVQGHGRLLSTSFPGEAGCVALDPVHKLGPLVRHMGPCVKR